MLLEPCRQLLLRQLQYWLNSTFWALLTLLHLPDEQLPALFKQHFYSPTHPPKPVGQSLQTVAERLAVAVASRRCLFIYWPPLHMLSLLLLLIKLGFAPCLKYRLHAAGAIQACTWRCGTTPCLNQQTRYEWENQSATKPARPWLCIVGTSPQAAFWDTKAKSWSTDGMSSVSSSGNAAGAVAFHSKTVGCFAVVSERTGLLPYQEWHVRPTGGQFGAEAMVAVQTSAIAT